MSTKSVGHGFFCPEVPAEQSWSSHNANCRSPGVLGWIMAPQRGNVSISRTWEFCPFTWQKGLGRCNYVSDLERQRPSWIIRVDPTTGQRRACTRAEVRERDLKVPGGRFGGGGSGHKPGRVGGLWRLEKARSHIVPESLQEEPGPADTSLLGLSTSRTYDNKSVLFSATAFVGMFIAAMEH